MKCLLKYLWVKLPRTPLPAGKGVMGYWAKLASKAAFRNGQASYCGYINDVSVGTWSGGVVGLKSILGVGSRREALEILDKLTYLGYIEYTLNTQTKKLTYKVMDYVLKCSGEPCAGPGAVYATDGYGFLCLPRGITERLAEGCYIFEESDALLDLWCHTVWQDPRNTFSNTAPVVQYGQYGAVLTLETLGQRWGWEKTKVWRFLQKHKDAFTLHKLPGSYGCLIFNMMYPTGDEISIPLTEDIISTLDEIRIAGQNTHLDGSDNERINKQIAWFSQKANYPNSIPDCMRIPNGIRIECENTYLDDADGENARLTLYGKNSDVPDQVTAVRIPDIIGIPDRNTYIDFTQPQIISINFCEMSKNRQNTYISGENLAFIRILPDETYTGRYKYFPVFYCNTRSPPWMTFQNAVLRFRPL